MSVCALSGSTAHAQTRNPNVTWRTLETEHFVIHYHTPLGVVARRVAVVAERATATIREVLGEPRGRRTHIVLTDGTDSANGSAIAVPVNTIRLNATAPSGLSPLSDYDDWMNTLVSHEHTHILHLDQWTGISSFINLFLGKVYAPNHVQPRFILEGIATWQESERTAGGRLRSTMFDMYLRMDALEDRFFDLDQVANVADRWPHGNVWYLYGSQLIEYIADRFGREAIARLVQEYGDETLPYGLNRIVRNATGFDWLELFEDFREAKRTHYEAMRDAVVAAGRVEGERITFHGEMTRAPRFVGRREIAYYRSDNRTRNRIMQFRLDRPNEQTTWARVSGEPGYALHPSRSYILYSTIDADSYRNFYHDLFRRDLTTGEVVRLTRALRAQHPDFSPDGRRVTFTTNEAGTTNLMIAESRDIEGTVRVLFASERFGQVFDPRFSPDGRTVAVSRWSRGGYRDVSLVDVATGEITDVTHDRALDTGPVWSSDGNTLYFSSDRTGIANIFAHDITSGRLRQITNVVAGAYQPAISEDGRELVYVGYTSYGFDLFHLHLDPEDARDAPAYVDTRPASIDDEDLFDGPSRDYQPLESLWPRSYLLNLTDNGFGPAIGISVSGEDFVGLHSWQVNANTGLTNGYINADMGYQYQGTPLNVSLRLFHRIAPRGGFRIAGEDRTWVEQALGGEIGLGWFIPETFESQSLGLVWRGTYTDNLDPFVVGVLDPNDVPPVFPGRGFTSELRLGWSYSDVERYGYDISASNGTSLGVNVAAAHPVIGSQFEAVELTWYLREYLRMPWLNHHVLAFAYSGGIASGDAGRERLFGVGGFSDANPIDGLLNNVIVGGVALRGYPAFYRRGPQYHLLQLEYRFPIWRINHGLLTLPLYLNRLSGSMFADAGDAFYGQLNFETIRVGVGGALLLDFTIGYVLAFTLRVGYARGLMEGGIDQVFGHLGVPF